MKNKLLVLSIIMLMVFAGSALAATVYVDDDTVCGGNSPCYTTIQAGINAAVAGDTVYVYDGTYAETPNVITPITLEGETRAGVVIDASGLSGYAITITAVNDVTLRTFTLIGTPNSYGIKASGNSNMVVEDVTVQNSYRTGIDYNGVNGGLVSNVEATGTVYGNGLAFTDCNNIDISDVTTSGNAWGGIAVYTYGRYYPGGSDDLQFTGSFNLAEPNPFYTEIENYNVPANPYPITNFGFPVQFTYIVEVPNIKPNHQFYQETNLLAEAFALATTDPDAIVFDINKDNYYVAVGMDLNDAIADATPGDQINLEAGTFQTCPGQVVIDKDLLLQGAGRDVTIVTPCADTGSSGDARGWFLVDTGIDFDVTDLTYDGTGHLIYQGIRNKGLGSVTNVRFTEIKYNPSGPTYGGVAIAIFGTGPLDVRDSVFDEIGRVGVLYFGATASGSVFQGNTYTGKGPGDWLDYALDIDGPQVDVLDNTISGNRGVASSDGSTSACILVTTFYATGSDVHLEGNTLTDCSAGIAVGYDGNDTSVVVARQNNIVGNEFGITSTGPAVDAIENWWGSKTGPSGSGPGTGDSVDALVTYQEWLCAPARTDEVSIAGRCPAANPGYGTSIGIVVGTEEVGPQIWLHQEGCSVYQSNANGGLDLIERVENYGFEGEVVECPVLVMDRNGIEKIKDVYVTVDGFVEADCDYNPAAVEPEDYNARHDDVVYEDWNADVMSAYTCTFTIEPTGSMHGEQVLSVVVEDLDGLADEIAEDQYWFFNPEVSVTLSGAIDFGVMAPGTVAYSDAVLIKNTAESGSGVLLNMKISGDDFYDPASSGAKCPTSNQLALGNFGYYASNGAYHTMTGNPRENPVGGVEGYYGIPYEVGDPTDREEIIEGAGNISLGGVVFEAGNVLSPGAEIAMIFRLALPVPCNGDFTDGSLYFWGTAI